MESERALDDSWLSKDKHTRNTYIYICLHVTADKMNDISLSATILCEKTLSDSNELFKYTRVTRVVGAAHTSSRISTEGVHKKVLTYVFSCRTKLEKLLCLKNRGSKSRANSFGFQTTNVVSSAPQDTTSSDAVSSTNWYVFVRKGAGTALPDSRQTVASSDSEPMADRRLVSFSGFKLGNKSTDWFVREPWTDAFERSISAFPSG